jgi:hypothetical protein
LFILVKKERRDQVESVFVVADHNKRSSIYIHKMKDNEMYLLVKDDQQRTPTKRWGVAVAAVMMVVCAAAAGAVCGGAWVAAARTTTALGAAPTSAKDGFCMRPECMHALGGGATRACVCV